MYLSVIDYYLIGVNILGFILYLVNTWLYSNTADKEIDTILTIASIMGASLGIVLAILLFDRKAQKGNMMSRVFVASVLVIQIILVLTIKGFIGSEITVAFWEFLGTHQLLLWYLVAINVITLVFFAVDKIRAIENKWRIRIITLLGLAFIGGSLGAIIAMYVFRHKTHTDYFTVGVPLIIVMQIVVVFYLMNVKV